MLNNDHPYTQIPNALLDQAMAHMGNAELRIVLAVLRKTSGWHKERDRISLTQFEEMTGLTRSNVLQGIKHAVMHKWIAQYESGIARFYELTLDAGIAAVLDAGGTVAIPEMVLKQYHHGTVAVPEVVSQQYTQKKGKKEEKERKENIVRSAKRARTTTDDTIAFFESLDPEAEAKKETPSTTPVPEQTRDESTSDAPAAKPKRSKKSGTAKVIDALSDADKQRRRDLFDAVTEICVLDPKACGARIGRTVKYLFEASATSDDVKAFLTWWSTNEYPGKLGKPPAPERVTEKWKQFRDGWAEHPRMTKGEATSVNRMARIYSDAVPNGEK